MKFTIALALAAAPFLSAQAAAQSVEAKPGNCAVWAEEASKIVQVDARFDAETRTSVVGALDTFAGAQRQIMADGMAKTYADSAAFGWDKAKVDAMIAQNEEIMRQRFTSPRMEPGKLYMDHIMYLNACVQANTQDSQYGMGRQDFIDKMTPAISIAQQG